jgi:hypothetical protein
MGEGMGDRWEVEGRPGGREGKVGKVFSSRMGWNEMFFSFLFFSVLELELEVEVCNMPVGVVVFVVK